MKFLYGLFACILLLLKSMAQSPVPVKHFHDNFQVHIAHAAGPVKIDGILDDSTWLNAEPATNFFLKYPSDQGRPKRKTVVKLAYDDKYLYASFTCYDSGNTIIQSLKRDIGQLNNDGVGLILDPLGQHSSGFIFVLNSYNAQSEDQVGLNQEQELAWSWNNKWFSATQRYPDRWTAEMAIPFKTLRYQTDKTTWGINFVRVDMKNNESSIWTQVPLNFRNYNLGFTGSLIWDNRPPAPGKNIVLIPYVTGGVQEDKENGQPTEATFNAGLDSKFTLSSSMNMDITINPDFSQVEVDQQVTNLTRYDIFLPEKRAFFLENADIFGEYGIPGFMTPFYSRRIGLDQDGNRIPIWAGVRLSGSLGQSTRIGIMDMQTGEKGTYTPENYAAVSVNQNVFGRSVIKGYFLNRQGLQNTDQQQNLVDNWGRNAGASFDYISRDGKWNAWTGFHQSFKPGIDTADKFIEFGLGYNGRKFSNILDLVSMGTNYYTDMGYVQRIENTDASRDTTIRVGFKHIFDDATVKLFPKKGKIHTHTFGLENYIVFNPNYSLNEWNAALKYTADYRNSSQISTTIMNDNVNLLFPISFTDDGSPPLPAMNYNYSQLNLKYFSDTRKKFSFTLQATGGGFYNGTLYSGVIGIIFRSQPHLNLVIQAEYDDIQFPKPYGSNKLLLISPRIEINFSTSISWTTFLQYNTQENNFNINSRFQYRFKPMSDIYIVYTDNYFTTPIIQNKNRAIVFKLNYWFNL
jgi:hypothetical protein